MEEKSQTNGDGVAVVAPSERASRRLSRPKRQFTFSRRASGVLMHLTSLPGPHGSGDLGPAAFRFADFLAAAGQRWWQMLPVGPPDVVGNSPYSASSAFAGSPWLVSLERLAEEGLLERSELKLGKPFRNDRVDYKRVYRFRELLLRRAFSRFTEQQQRWLRDLESFRRRSAGWLEDFALYSALKSNHGNKAWITWPKPLRHREPAAIEKARHAIEREIAFHEFVQFAFDRQWTAL